MINIVPGALIDLDKIPFTNNQLMLLIFDDPTSAIFHKFQ